MKAFRTALVLAAVAARGAAGQVGYPPAQSPFLDVEHRHEITVLGGYFSAKKDPAKAAPQGGPLIGLQYEWRAGGPVMIGVSAATVRSDRNRLDPGQPPATRVASVERQPLILADAFLAVSLTGARSWHHLMPLVGAGLGMATYPQGDDPGGFKFGTRFALPWSAGVRWVPAGGRLEMRADIKDWMYTIKYPQGYYTSSPSVPAILSRGTPTSMWTNNFAMTVGLSYTFRR